MPLIFFWLRGALTRDLKFKLVSLLALGGFQGFIGWWMVSSGLVNRIEVAQERLAIHLLLATQFEMEAHFFLQIALQLVAMEKHLDAALDFARQAHTLLLCRLDNLGDCAHDALELA